MKRTFALSFAGALAAGAALIAAPEAAQAQVGISVGFGPGYGYDYYDDDDFDYAPAPLGLGVASPVGYYGNPYVVSPAPVGVYGGYAAPEYRVATTGSVVRTRIVQRNPTRRVVVGYEQPRYYAPRQVVRTRVVTRAPRYVTQRVVSGRVVRGSPAVNGYLQPELRQTESGVVRTRVIHRNPTTRAYY